MLNAAFNGTVLNINREEKCLKEMPMGDVCPLSDNSSADNEESHVGNHICMEEFDPCCKERMMATVSTNKELLTNGRDPLDVCGSDTAEIFNEVGILHMAVAKPEFLSVSPELHENQAIDLSSIDPLAGSSKISVKSIKKECYHKWIKQEELASNNFEHLITNTDQLNDRHCGNVVNKEYIPKANACTLDENNFEFNGGNCEVGNSSNETYCLGRSEGMLKAISMKKDPVSNNRNLSDNCGSALSGTLTETNMLITNFKLEFEAVSTEPQEEETFQIMNIDPWAAQDPLCLKADQGLIKRETKREAQDSNSISNECKEEALDDEPYLSPIEEDPLREPDGVFEVKDIKLEINGDPATHISQPGRFENESLSITAGIRSVRKSVSKNSNTGSMIEGRCTDNSKQVSIRKGSHHKGMVCKSLKHKNNDQQLFKCAHCYESFATRRGIVKHLKRNCGSNEAHTCITCGKTYSMKCSLNCHKRLCGRKRSYKCPNCSKTFSVKYNLDYHIKHDCGRKVPHKCSNCSKSYSMKLNLVYHMKHDCGRTEPHKCRNCGKTYSTKYSLNKHVKQDCGHEEPHKCPNCSKTFSLKRNLMKHVNRNCGNREPFKCPNCEKTYFNKDSFVQHVNQDCGNEKQHKCPNCSRTYRLKRSLSQHLKHDCSREERHKCPKCGKTYSMKGLLNLHVRLDCGRKEHHKCPKCGKAYSIKDSLVKHIKYTSCKDSYKCVHCEKSFAAKSSLIYHLKHKCYVKLPL